jgi:hypothetical protein
MKLGKLQVPTTELGDTWTLDGVFYSDGWQSIALLLPFAADYSSGLYPPTLTRPTEEQWEEFLRQTDDPVTPVGKAFLRKASRQLDQGIVWRCYKRDNYTCVYCGTKDGPFTYDHYLAQKFGGQTTMENGRTSCRKCNKLKGHQTISEWKETCVKRGLNDGEVLTD